jgi:putative hemolysin
MISQLAENDHLQDVFRILFDAEGCEIYLKPANDYVHTNTPINYYTVVESAALKNETAIGYRLNEFARDAGKTYGIVVSPDKNQIINFSDKDNIIVIADN